MQNPHRTVLLAKRTVDPGAGQLLAQYRSWEGLLDRYRRAVELLAGGERSACYNPYGTTAHIWRSLRRSRPHAPAAIGQGAFRLAVTDGYGRQCAVSGENTLPILDAAHVRAFGEGGDHDISNDLLLRADIHRLFDLGYVTVTERNRLAGSERLKADCDNGVHYYAMQGTEIAAPRPGFPPPALETLQLHRETRYPGWSTD